MNLNFVLSEIYISLFLLIWKLLSSLQVSVKSFRCGCIGFFPYIVEYIDMDVQYRHANLDIEWLGHDRDLGQTRNKVFFFWFSVS